MKNIPSVIFIGGYGRSGSTLLDRLLGQLPGFCSVGELRYLWTRGLKEARLCACGTPIPECSFWSKVIHDVSRKTDVSLFSDETLKVQKSVDRIRHIPKILHPRLRNTDFKRNLDRYTHLLSTTYRSIQKNFGCHTIIDSSKDPSHGFLLTQIPDIDLKMIHLVRDSRAVAHSWKRKKRNLDVKDRVVYMRTLHPAESASMWMISNLLSEHLANRIAHATRLRYEDFVENPRKEVTRIIQELQLKVADEDLRRIFLSNNELDLSKTTHNVAGNPGKFSKGPVKVQPDQEWIHALPTSQKLLVTTITLPLLLKYKYPLWPGEST